MKKLLPALALFVAPLLGSDSPTGYDGATVVADEALQGTWGRVRVERNGQLLMTPYVVVTFRGRTWEEKTGGHVRRGIFTVDPSRNPRRLDLVHPDDPPGTVRKFIYQVNGDTLRVAYTWRLASRRRRSTNPTTKPASTSPPTGARRSSRPVLFVCIDSVNLGNPQRRGVFR